MNKLSFDYTPCRNCVLQAMPWFDKDVLILACLTLIAVCSTAIADSETGSPAVEPDGDGSMSYVYAQENPDWFGMSFLDIAEDVEEAAAENKHYGLYFYQDGCPYCEKLINDNFGQYRINEYAKANFNIAPINIFGAVEVTDLDGIPRPESVFSEHRKIQFTPTLIFFSPLGEVFRMNGYYPPHKFLAMLEYITDKYYLKDITFIDFLQAKEVSPASDEMHYASEMLRLPLDMTENTLGANKPVLVLFEQPRCLACDELHLDVLKREASDELYRQFETVMINVYGKETLVPPNGSGEISEKAWARKLGIKYTPSLVFYQRQSKNQPLAEVFRVEGYVKTFHVQSAMEYILSQAYAKPQDFQEFIRLRAESMRPEDGHLDIMH